MSLNRIFGKLRFPKLKTERGIPDMAYGTCIATEELLKALVDGKLDVKRVEPVFKGQVSMKIAYDRIVISKHTIVFYYKNMQLWSMDLPDIVEGNTITVDGLEGYMPFHLSYGSSDV